MATTTSPASTFITQEDNFQPRVAGWLAPDEFHIVEAVCETLLPSLEPPTGSSPELSAYYRRKASDLHVAMLLAETLAHENADTQTEFRQLLAFMASAISGLILLGKPRPFLAFSPEQREAYMSAMANSGMVQIRQGFQAMKRLAMFIFYSVPNPEGINPNWSVLDYDAPTPPPADAPRPIRPLAVTGDTTLECDAVVVGSGAGGGVVAGELASAGKRVIVLEKGGYNSESDFTYQEAQATPELYLKRGLLSTRDLNMFILAGSTLGGGTVVNWTTSFRAPDRVLEEWAHSSGLSEFIGSSLQESYGEVERRIQVNLENSGHNRQNQLIIDGGNALGYHAAALPRNAVGCDQRCGSCGFGCRYGSKQSTMRTYLQDAYEHGARILVRASVDTVLIEQGQAVGVKAKVVNTETGETHKVTVRAKAVILAAGTISTPAILLRSQVENKHIGQHLKLHPVSTVAGVYNEKIYPWKGVMQSAYCDEFAYLDKAYGYKLEVAPVHPGLLGLATPWYNAREHRDMMLDASHTGTIIVLTRDKGEGRVGIDRDGEPVVDYQTSVYDRRHLLHGLKQAARVHFAAGARRVLTLQNKKNTVERQANGDVRPLDLRTFDAQVERFGLGPNRILMFSAHQMGTCRMGADAKSSVIDGNCEVHGVKNLFVCDGSTFPAASGVNPMLTIMAISHRAAQHLKERC
jgi:choline dehydrogenase-like flavoprotein